MSQLHNYLLYVFQNRWQSQFDKGPTKLQERIQDFFPRGGGGGVGGSGGTKFHRDAADVSGEGTEGGGGG